MTIINRRHVSRNRPSGDCRVRSLAPRWLLPAALAAALGVTAVTAPAPARAQDDLVRVLVDVADVIFRSGTPYYRHGGYDDRLTVVRDRYGNSRYYRYLPRHIDSRYGDRRVKCNKHGKCKVSYYDPRYDRDRYDRRRHHRGRDWDDRDWDDDDDRHWRRARYWRDHDDDDDD